MRLGHFGNQAGERKRSMNQSRSCSSIRHGGLLNEGLKEQNASVDTTKELTLDKSFCAPANCPVGRE